MVSCPAKQCDDTLTLAFTSRCPCRQSCYLLSSDCAQYQYTRESFRLAQITTLPIRIGKARREHTIPPVKNRSARMWCREHERGWPVSSIRHLSLIRSFFFFSSMFEKRCRINVCCSSDASERQIFRAVIAVSDLNQAQPLTSRMPEGVWRGFLCRPRWVRAAIGLGGRDIFHIMSRKALQWQPCTIGVRTIFHWRGPSFTTFDPPLPVCLFQKKKSYTMREK